MSVTDIFGTSGDHITVRVNIDASFLGILDLLGINWLTIILENDKVLQVLSLALGLEQSKRWQVIFGA